MTQHTSSFLFSIITPWLISSTEVLWPPSHSLLLWRNFSPGLMAALRRRGASAHSLTHSLTHSLSPISVRVASLSPLPYISGAGLKAPSAGVSLKPGPLNKSGRPCYYHGLPNSNTHTHTQPKARTCVCTVIRDRGNVLCISSLMIEPQLTTH